MNGELIRDGRLICTVAGLRAVPAASAGGESDGHTTCSFQVRVLWSGFPHAGDYLLRIAGWPGAMPVRVTGMRQGRGTAVVLG